MKSIYLAIILLFGGTLTYSQTVQHLLSLDNYTIPLNQKGGKIGRFLNSSDEKITLVKDTSGLFVINEKNEIYLKKNKAVKSNDSFIYGITVKHGNKTKEFDLVANGFLKNKVVAHRGAWKHYDVHQNSMGALEKAIELGCEASEFDVWLSRDKRVALNHDHEIDGLIIEETDLAEMRKIILEANEVMATLEQYIDRIKQQNKTRIILEFKTNPKNERYAELVDSSMNIIHRMKAQAWVDYISFDYRALLRVRAIDQGAHTAYLGADRPMDLQRVEGMSGIDYHFSQFDKIERMYERARILGLTINIWTVNDFEFMKKLLDMDVDFITTDEPEILLEEIRRRKN